MDEIRDIAISLIEMDRHDGQQCRYNHCVEIDERGLIWIDGKKIPDYDKSDWKERYWDASEYMKAARTLYHAGYYIRWQRNHPILFTPDGYPAEGVRARNVERAYGKRGRKTQAKPAPGTSNKKLGRAYFENAIDLMHRKNYVMSSEAFEDLDFTHVLEEGNAMGAILLAKKRKKSSSKGKKDSQAGFGNIKLKKVF